MNNTKLLEGLNTSMNNTIASENNFHYAIIYQITQECPFQCDICLRPYVQGEAPATDEERRELVKILKQRDIKSISVTGGEPLILNEQLFDFLKYLHKNEIHTCLSTTGYKLTEERVLEMNDYLDRIVISIRSFDFDDWKNDFGDTPYTPQMFNTVINLLQWVKRTEIVLEVTTVLHKEDVDRIIEVGNKLADLNSNIVWRVDEYYPIGKMSQNKQRFQLDDGEFEKLSVLISEELSGRFKDLRFSSWAARHSRPGLLITQSGNIMTSSGEPTGLNVFKNEFPPEFRMSRPWSEYQKVVRDWGWGDVKE